MDSWSGYISPSVALGHVTLCVIIVFIGPWSALFSPSHHSHLSLCFYSCSSITLHWAQSHQPSLASLDRWSGWRTKACSGIERGGWPVSALKENIFLFWVLFIVSVCLTHLVCCFHILSHFSVPHSVYSCRRGDEYMRAFLLMKSST